MRDRFLITPDELRDSCRRWQIIEFALFGSRSSQPAEFSMRPEERDPAR